MILQLNPTLTVNTPLGKGQAIFLIDYGVHQNSCWVVALEKDGIVKHFDSNDITLCVNYTYHFNLDNVKPEFPPKSTTDEDLPEH